jgi:hypothetical protein
MTDTEKVAISIKTPTQLPLYSLDRSEFCFEPESDELTKILIDLNNIYGEGTFFSTTKAEYLTMEEVNEELFNTYYLEQFKNRSNLYTENNNEIPVVIENSESYKSHLDTIQYLFKQQELNRTQLQINAKLKQELININRVYGSQSELNKVKALIEQGTNADDNADDDALRLSFTNGYLEVVKSLLKCEKELIVKEQESNLPSHNIETFQAVSDNIKTMRHEQNIDKPIDSLKSKLTKLL